MIRQHECYCMDTWRCDGEGPTTGLPASQPRERQACPCWVQQGSTLTSTDSCSGLLVRIHDKPLSPKPFQRWSGAKTNISELALKLFPSLLPPLEGIHMTLSTSRCSEDAECVNKGRNKWVQPRSWGWRAREKCLTLHDGGKGRRWEQGWWWEAGVRLRRLVWLSRWEATK